MTPPANGDMIGPAELARMLRALTKLVEDLRAEIKGLSSTYTPREVHDLALGGIKIDIRRIDEQSQKEAAALTRAANDLDGRLDEQEREVSRRFRQSVILVVTALLAPLTVGLVIYVLTSVTKAGVG